MGALWLSGSLLWILQAHFDLCKVTSKFDQSFSLGLKIDTCSSFVCAIALSGQKAIHAIKAFKSIMVVMWVLWALMTDDVPAYASQQFNDFLGSWKISHTTDIP